MPALLGFLIAYIVGIAGMGGGPLAAPLLMLVLGVPSVTAVGTSLAFVAVTKAAAAALYLRRGQIDRDALLRLLMGGVPGVLIGTYLLQRASASRQLQPYVLTLIGAVIAVMALLTLWRLFKPAQVERGERRQQLPFYAAPIGLEVGFSSAGAGALTGLTLLHCTSLAPATVVGTDLAFGLSIALVGGGMHLAGGTIDHTLLWTMLAGGVPGALAGAWTAGHIPARAVRAVLAGVMVFLGQQLLSKGLAGFAH